MRRHACSSIAGSAHKHRMQQATAAQQAPPQTPPSIPAAMKSVSLSAAYFQGAASVQAHADGGLQPWRLPHQQHHLFPSPNDSLLVKASHGSGVRLYFTSATTAIELLHGPLAEQDPQSLIPSGEMSPHSFDVTVNGKIVAHSVASSEGSTRIDGLPVGRKALEVWLPQASPITIFGLKIDSDTDAVLEADPRPVWITYGSSLTHCTRAFSPAKTWPAIVAREHGLHLISLGFGGDCHMEPMMGFLIRSLAPDYITMKLGINTKATLGPRTYSGVCLGLVKIIREVLPSTPITMISPIGYPPNETEPTETGNTMVQMRTDLKEVTRRLADDGDVNIRYVDGLAVFNVDEIAQHTTDECHPDGDGMFVQARNFSAAVMSGWYQPQASKL
jgi:hypothetical protein